ncbi:hypothetical protein VN97_g7264, partial [Penicillium thymicola]
GGVGGYL